MAILGQVAPYAPDYQPTLDEQLAVLGSAPAAAPVSQPAPMSVGMSSPLASFAPPKSSAPLGSMSNLPGAGLGVLPLAQVPAAATSFTGIGQQYGAPPPQGLQVPQGGPVAPSMAPQGAPAPKAAPRAAGAAGGGMSAASQLEKMRAGELERQANVAGAEAEATGESFAAQKGAQATINQATEEAAQTAREAAEAQYGSALAAQGRAADVAEARQRAVQASENDYQNAQKALDNTKIDVDRAYGGTAGRIFAGLAVALGSFGSSMTGGPNYALQIVNDRINRDLDAQRSELDKAKGKVGELGRVLQNNQKMLGDAESARDLTVAQTYRALREQIEKTQTAATATARGQQMIQQLTDKETEAMSRLRERQAQFHYQATELPVVAKAQREAAAAQAAAREAADRRKDERELQMFTDKEAIKAHFAGLGPEAAAKAANVTAELGTKIHDKGYAAAARQYFDLADNLGIDPITGTPTGKDPAGVGLYHMGIVTPEGRINRQGLNALAERMAKSFGGVVTESDRAAAEKLLKGAGTVEDIQRGLYAYGRGMAADLNVLVPGREQGFQLIAQRSPELGRLVQVGQQQSAAKSAGFKPVGQ